MRLFIILLLILLYNSKTHIRDYPT